MQITRQRVRPEMKIDTMEKCPMCTGNGKIDSSLLLIETIENKIQKPYSNSKRRNKISFILLLASHINKGIFFTSIRHKWRKKFNRKITISGDERLHLLQYSIIN